MRYLYLRRRGQLPWGYKVCDLDPQLCEPIPEQLESLKEALIYLKGSSIRECATWLSLKTGRNMHFMTLQKIAKKDFDKQYPSSQTPHGKVPWEDAQDKCERPGRPKGSRTAPEKLAVIRRKNEAKKRRKAKANPKGTVRRGPKSIKRSYTPRIIKPTLRERRLGTSANNIQAERGSTDDLLECQ